MYVYFYVSFYTLVVIEMSNIEKYIDVGYGLNIFHICGTFNLLNIGESGNLH